MPRKPQANTVEPVESVTKVDHSALLKKVNLALQASTKAQALMHDAACEVLSHFATHRNNNIINHLYNGLKKNDKDAFRMWAVKHARKEKDDGTFSCFFRFSTKEGFTVVKGQASDHVQPYDVLLLSPSFFDIDQEKEKAEDSAEKLLAMIAGLQAKLVKRVEGLEEDERGKIPAALIEEASRFSRIATEAKARLH